MRVIIAAAVFAFGMLAGAGIAAWLMPPAWASDLGVMSERGFERETRSGTALRRSQSDGVVFQLR
jgi:hypothetical protein